MRGTTLSAFGLALAATGLLAAGPAWADSTVCYRNKADYNDSTRIVLNVKFHSWLTGRQAVYEADGKHAFVENYKNRMAVFDGAVVTSRGLKYQPPGAHLGRILLGPRRLPAGSPRWPDHADRVGLHLGGVQCHSPNLVLHHHRRHR